jgi:hypothetical protein
MKSPDRTRVAVIGDSYVEAFQVPHYASLAEQLEALLGEDRTEVYRFGISGGIGIGHPTALRGLRLR